MLAQSRLMAFVCTANEDKARGFYRDTLGLTLLEEHQFAMVFDANGIELRVSKSATHQPARHTVLGWQVPDIVASVKQLENAGVVFHRYEGMGQDENAVWKAPGGSKVAWFPDPDGNVLSLTEHPL